MKVSSRFIALALLALTALPLAAQQVTGNITGTVMDKSGSVIPGANIKLTSASTGAMRQTTANKDGDFEFNAVLAGNYRVEVSHPGFKKLEQTGIELTAGQSLTLNELHLEVGDVS